jgi:hypothetical protein
LHHFVIDVVRLDPTETSFRYYAKLYASRDMVATSVRNDSRGKPIMQQTHVQETGRFLGLGHVDIGRPHCPANGGRHVASDSALWDSCAKEPTSLSDDKGTV